MKTIRKPYKISSKAGGLPEGNWEVLGGGDIKRRGLQQPRMHQELLRIAKNGFNLKVSTAS